MASGAFRIALVAVCAAACCARAALAAPPGDVTGVELWGGLPAPEGRVVDVSLEGVRVQAEGGEAAELVGWQRVRLLTGEPSEEAARFADIGRMVWRAASRLERGDAVLAEPMFEELYRLYGLRTGPTAAVVAEGLLRCRLRRGSYANALEPFLAWLTSDGGGAALASRPLVDSAYGLPPSLPPFWLDSVSLDALLARETDMRALADRGDVRAREVARLYLASASIDAGLGAGFVGPAPIEDQGVLLLTDLVTVRSSEPTARAEARDRLMERIDEDTPAWVEAWVRFGVGQSLLMEPGDATRRAGVVELLHVPVRFGSVQPYLAGVALARAAAAMDEIGPSDEADRLFAELADRFVGHPALEWGPVRAWREARSGEARRPGSLRERRDEREDQTPLMAPIGSGTGSRGAP